MNWQVIVCRVCQGMNWTIEYNAYWTTEYNALNKNVLNKIVEKNKKLCWF